MAAVNEALGYAERWLDNLLQQKAYMRLVVGKKNVTFREERPPWEKK